jgi:hypothetical protein
VPGTTYTFSCTQGFQPSFTPLAPTCVSAGASAAWVPATAPSCFLEPPVFPAQKAYVVEGAARGDDVGPDPLKASLQSPFYAIEWSLGLATDVNGAPWAGAFTISSCTGQITLLSDNVTSPALRPRVATGQSAYLGGYVNVTAGVAGFATAQASQLVPIYVVPQDQQPVLAASTLTVPENSVSGVEIGSPPFFDWDMTWNVPAWSTYKWSWADASGLLSINAQTGVVSVNSSSGVRAGQLNYETLLPTHSYGQITRVTEVNSSLFASTATVTIALLDMNDPPTVPPGQQLVVSETAVVSVGALVGNVNGADEDNILPSALWAGATSFAVVSPAAALAYDAALRYSDVSCVAGQNVSLSVATVDGTPGGAQVDCPVQA